MEEQKNENQENFPPGHLLWETGLYIGENQMVAPSNHLFLSVSSNIYLGLILGLSFRSETSYACENEIQ